MENPAPIKGKIGHASAPRGMGDTRLQFSLSAERQAAPRSKRRPKCLPNFLKKQKTCPK